MCWNPTISINRSWVIGKRVPRLAHLLFVFCLVSCRLLSFSAHMCNAYKIGPDASQQQLELVSRVVALLPPGKTHLIRKTNHAPVLISGDIPQVMRWGFHRSFNPAINNTRSDKLDAGMWAEAFRDRRCLIPMSAFYEWGPGTGGKKQAHEFRNPDGGFLWVAGIWEQNPELGLCYSMITTDASPAMLGIHTRMPAILPPDRVGDFLAGNRNLSPFPGPLAVTPCISPLIGPSNANSQPELF